MASPPYPYFAEVSGAATSLLIHARRKKARTLLYCVMYRCPITVTRYASMHAMQNVISLLALEKRRLENVQLDIEPARLVSGSARYNLARYGSTRYISLYKQARKLARLGSLVARASSFGSRARV